MIGALSQITENIRLGFLDVVATPASRR